MVLVIEHIREAVEELQRIGPSRPIVRGGGSVGFEGHQKFSTQPANQIVIYATGASHISKNHTHLKVLDRVGPCWSPVPGNTDYHDEHWAR